MKNSLDSTLYNTVRPELVPEISDDRISELRQQIEPLMRLPRELYCRITGIDDCDARNVSFLWDAEPEGESLVFSPLECVSIITFHTWGAPSLFKPSLAEVYAAIDRFIPDTDDVRFFCLRSESLGPEHVIGDCHWCVCDLFGRPANTDWIDDSGKV